MENLTEFERRVGKVFIPVADTVGTQTPPGDSDAADGPGDGQQFGPLIGIDPEILRPQPQYPFKFCSTTLKQGCYTFTWRPASARPILAVTGYRGTIRVENVTGGIRFSGDVYTYKLPIIWPKEPVLVKPGPKLPPLTTGASVAVPLSEFIKDGPGTIPIYSRKSYRSYLKGTSAALVHLRPLSGICTFTLTFQEFNYTHPATGFSGSFPTAPTRTIRMVMQKGATADTYTGTVYSGTSGTTSLGTITMSWVSPSYRRASLIVHTLTGSVAPAPVTTSGTTEYFPSVFQTAGWDLSVTNGGAITLPATLTGVNANQCWSSANLHTLLQSVPGYNNADLDSQWKAHLLCVPSALGCSRGQMFDTANGGANPNAVAREGAATYSDDGYDNNVNYGAANNGLQRNFPRAFLRSASHEVGHTFNQIHQGFEAGNDNSIMTPTPSVANFLAAAGQTFPDDIHLGFNATVIRHLRHLPDPAVRPGAMEFFGAAVTAPQADDVIFPDEFKLKLKVPGEHVALGEALQLGWSLVNVSGDTVIAPQTLGIDDLTARVSVTDPDGKITFLRPIAQDACPENRLTYLASKETRASETAVYWGRDGFTFQRPGRHLVDVIILWDVQGVQVAAAAQTEVWVDFPLSPEENQVANLMLDEDVGRAVALGQAAPGGRAAQRLAEAARIAPSHPAVARLHKLGIAQKLGIPK